MANVKTETIFGTRVDKNLPVNSAVNEAPKLWFYDPRYLNKADPRSVFTMTQKMLETHLLLLGGPGSGKTNVIKLIMKILRNARNNIADTANDVFIIFDTKGDYFDEFYREGDIVIANDSSPNSKYRRVSGYRTWNIFSEMDAAAPDHEMFAKEMSASLFADRKNQQSPFFTNAAEDVFANLLTHLYRHNRGNYNVLNNKALVDQIKTSETDYYKRIFSAQLNPDMTGLNSYFGDGNTPQGLGVFGEMKSMVYDAFSSAFAESSGPQGFSIRRAVRNRGGKAIFIEYDISKGQVLTPIYRLLIDMALKETLGRSSLGHGHVWFILDELKLLPHSMHLGDGLNLGRSMGVSIIAGMQSVEQMYEIYGKDGGQVICGGFSNIFALPVSDFESRDYVRNLFGQNMYFYKPDSSAFYTSTPTIREGYVVEDWDIAALTRGNAVVGLNGYPPFLFKFEQYKK